MLTWCPLCPHLLAQKKYVFRDKNLARCTIVIDMQNTTLFTQCIAMAVTWWLILLHITWRHFGISSSERYNHIKNLAHQLEIFNYIQFNFFSKFHHRKYPFVDYYSSRICDIEYLYFRPFRWAKSSNEMNYNELSTRNWLFYGIPII